MNKFIIAFTFFITLSFNLAAQNDTSFLTEEQQEKVKSITQQWFALSTNQEDINSLMKISKTPFFSAGSMSHTEEELTTFYTKQTKREVPKISIDIINPENIDPKYIDFNLDFTDLKNGYALPENAVLTIVTILDKKLEGTIFLVIVDISEDVYKIVGCID